MGVRGGEGEDAVQDFSLNGNFTVDWAKICHLEVLPLCCTDVLLTVSSDFFGFAVIAGLQ